MDNQHEKIKGYRDLSEQEIYLMNEVKELAEKCGELTGAIGRAEGIDMCWLSIGITDLQKGFMAVTRSIAKPTTF